LSSGSAQPGPSTKLHSFFSSGDFALCDCILCRLRALEDRASESTRKRPWPDIEGLKRQVEDWETLLQDFDKHIPFDSEAFRLTNQLRLQIVIRIEGLRAFLDYVLAEREVNKNQNQFAA